VKTTILCRILPVSRLGKPWTTLIYNLQGKHKQRKSFSSSSQAQSDISASLFVVIVSFHFIFIYTCSFEFIIMFYLIYVIFFAGHSSLSVVIGATSQGCCTTRSSTRLSSSRWPERLSHRLPRTMRPARRLSRSRRGHRLRTVMRWVPNRGRPLATGAIQL
jgi:hypothetical protein